MTGGGDSTAGSKNKKMWPISNFASRCLHQQLTANSSRSVDKGPREAYNLSSEMVLGNSPNNVLERRGSREQKLAEKRAKTDI